jgi:hypothetical protein
MSNPNQAVPAPGSDQKPSNQTPNSDPKQNNQPGNDQKQPGTDPKTAGNTKAAV